MEIKAGMIAAQNVGSVISFNVGWNRFTTTLEGFERSEDGKTVYAYTPIADDPFALPSTTAVEISLPKPAHDMSILLKEFMRFVEDVRDEWEDRDYTITNNYSEAVA